MKIGLIDKYAWVKDIEAWTVAVVEGATVDDVIRIYGGNPGVSVGNYYFADMADLQGAGEPEPLKFHVQVFNHDRYVVALENNGYTGSVPEIARRCSAGDGRFFSVFWNVNAFGMLTQAIGGKVTASVEALYPVLPESYPHEVRPTWATGPQVDVESAWQTCLALMEQQTGLAFKPRWLTEKRPTYRIPDPDAMLRDVEDARVL